MKIFGNKRTNRPSTEVYATSAEFCRVFEEDMDRLYLLSLLLTADSELAKQCLVRGLEDSRGGNPVFKEWARSWARRMIIKNAIRMIGPRPGLSSPFVRSSARKNTPGLPERLAGIIDLPAFERFVFVMSVLEGYSARDCRLLLNCSNFDVAQARVQALQQLAKSAEAFGKTQERDSQPASEDPETRLRQELIAEFAASA